jgi:hypothetical protein
MINTKVFPKTIQGNNSSDTILWINVQFSMLSQSLLKDFLVPFKILFDQKICKHKCFVPVEKRKERRKMIVKIFGE